MRTLALDVDSVLAETNGAFLSTYNRKYGTNYNLNDITYWGWPIDEFGYEKFHGMTENQWQERWLEIESCEPNLSEKVSELCDHFEVHIVTARSGCDESIKNWLSHYGIDGFTSFNSGVEDKVDGGYDVYIDDNPNMIEEIDDEQTLFLKSRNWNSSSQKQNVIGVQSIVDALNYV